MARDAGKTIRKNFSLKVIADWKADGTPLTKTDTDINAMVIQTVKKYFPSHSVLAEEENHTVAKSTYVWCCDPIDGTIPFSHGLPNSTFTLALLEDGEPILGVICEPFQNLILSAVKNGGAYIQDAKGTKKIAVNTYTTFTSKVIHVDGLQKNGNIYSSIFARKGFACTYLSTVYGAKQVATGHFIGSIYYGKNPWDVAAVKIITEEAGGRCTSIHGEDQKYDAPIDGFIASNGILHTELLKMVTEFDR